MFQTKIFSQSPRNAQRISSLYNLYYNFLLAQGQITLVQPNFWSPGATGRPLVLNTGFVSDWWCQFQFWNWSQPRLLQLIYIRLLSWSTKASLHDLLLELIIMLCSPYRRINLIIHPQMKQAPHWVNHVNPASWRRPCWVRAGVELHGSQLPATAPSLLAVRDRHPGGALWWKRCAQHIFP